jgi:hypothetical protein
MKCWICWKDRQSPVEQTSSVLDSPFASGDRGLNLFSPFKDDLGDPKAFSNSPNDKSASKSLLASLRLIPFRLS